MIRRGAVARPGRPIPAVMAFERIIIRNTGDALPAGKSDEKWHTTICTHKYVDGSARRAVSVSK